MLTHSRAHPPPIESLYIENLRKNIINLEQVQRGQLKCSGSQKDICKKKLQIRGSTKRDYNLRTVDSENRNVERIYQTH